MAEVKRTIMLGYTPNLYPFEYNFYTSTRSPTTKRPRPQGVELLFNGTSVSNQSQRYLRERYGGVWGPSTIRWEAGFVRATPVEPPTPSDVAALRAAIKAQKVNVAQFLAEFPQTAKLFVDVSQRVLRAIRVAKTGNPLEVLDALAGGRKPSRKHGRGDPSSFSAPSDRLAKNHLAFTYGVKPLMSDLNGALTELISSARSRPFIFPVRVTRSVQTSGSSTIVNDGAWVIAADSINQFFWKKKLKTVAWIEMEKGTWLNDASRFGFLNLVALAWELIPYSFVVDWLLNVGECLSNLDSLVGVKRLGIHRTVSFENFVLTDIVAKNASGFGCQCWYRTIGKSRTFDDSLPQVTIKWQPYLSFSRILSSLALARASIR